MTDGEIVGKRSVVEGSVDSVGVKDSVGWNGESVGSSSTRVAGETSCERVSSMDGASVTDASNCVGCTDSKEMVVATGAGSVKVAGDSPLVTLTVSAKDSEPRAIVAGTLCCVVGTGSDSMDAVSAAGSAGMVIEALPLVILMVSGMELGAIITVGDSILTFLWLTKRQSPG